MSDIARIQESSQYLATLLHRRADFVHWLVSEKNLYRRYPLTQLYEDLKRSSGEVESFPQLMLRFRELKQKHFLRIGGRDLLGLADLSETTSQLSDLACVALQVGLEWLSHHSDEWVPRTEREEWTRVRDDYRLAVMGMGKLGGYELNYVSDIDLLFLHAPKDPDRSDSPESQVLLSRLCQRLARLMGDSMEGDRVFLVDLRLRPSGRDGALVPSLDAATDHYLMAGRAWERQVLLKARPVAGDRSLGTEFIQEVRPFVFRRFLDFQALDELKAMRDRILTEAVRPHKGFEQFDVKLGVGGIREIEFLVQSLQLIYGGRHTELDESNTLRCLDRLGELELLTREVARELKEAYAFLRRVEHWVQLDQNRQTQKLPTSPEARDRLAVALGCQGGERGFLEELEAWCTRVHGHFLALFHASDEGEGGPGQHRDQSGPDGALDPESPAIDLSVCYSAESLSRLYTHLGSYPAFLRTVIERVLGQQASLGHPELSERALARLTRYFGQVRARPGLVKMFHSSAGWIEGFCLGLVQSGLLSDLLSHNPSLVEAIAAGSGTCPGAASWAASGDKLLARSTDYEESLEWIRRLKNERILQLVLADLRGDLSYRALEGEVSALADFVIRNTYGRVLQGLGLDADLPLCVLALGKLGSREMSYLSDLDLVFVYEPRPGEPEGEVPADVFRLIQRFMRMLSTPLQEGPGYSVDARLRPTGSFGPLIVTRRSWLDYYSHEADIWEVQALLRVRSVAGDPGLGGWIEEKAREICYRKREPSEVWERLCHLRQRMQRERSEEKGEAIDIKLGMGGLADLEFLVQGHLLIHGYGNPDLQKSSVRDALTSVAENSAGLGIPVRDVQIAFENLRSLDHRLRIYANHSSSRLTSDQFNLLKAVGLWPPAHEGGPIEKWEDLLRLRRRVRSLLLPFCPGL